MSQVTAVASSYLVLVTMCMYVVTVAVVVVSALLLL